jgi:peptide-methionine (S)-S-oxide reductase
VLVGAAARELQVVRPERCAALFKRHMGTDRRATLGTRLFTPEVLEVFWRSHDPTTRDRQGNDVGPQYRSVVFYHSDRQRRVAERYKEKIDAAGVFGAPVVTEVVPFVAFYPAEVDHQDYYARKPRQPYCRAVIGPKLDKLRKVFRDRLKAE